MQIDQRTRMFRVLAVLALAMTAVSALLFSLEPATIMTTSQLSVPRCVAAAKAAVDRRDVPTSSWRGVTIVPMAPPSDQRTLTAVGPRDDVHFMVARTGDVVAHPSWQRQLRFQGADEIRIGLADPAPAEPGARMQLVALSSLLEELRPALAVAGAAPHIRIEHGEEPSVERSLAQALRSLLNSSASKS